MRMGFACAVALAAAVCAQGGERRLMWCAQISGMESPTNYVDGIWERHAESLRKAGITDLIVAISRGNMAHYDSKLLTHTSAVAKRAWPACLAACHKRGIKVHAWRVCFRLHEDPLAPATKASAEALIAQTDRVDRMFSIGKGRYMHWLNPSVRSNQDLEISALIELADLAGADGIHIDYLRHRDGLCCCERCLNIFTEKTGRRLTKDFELEMENPEFNRAWTEYRQESLTRIIREASKAIRANHPGMEISAAVQNQNMWFAQNWPLWLENGYVDFVCPMDYTPETDDFRELVQSQKAQRLGSRGKIYPGIGFSAGAGRWPDDGGDMRRFREQVEVTRSEGMPGFCLFDLVYGKAKVTRFMPEICNYLNSADGR